MYRLQAAPARAVQQELFDRSQYRTLPIQVVSQSVKWPQSVKYRRWWCSPRRDRQRHEALLRQRFRCWQCGYLLGRRYDVHHARGYGELGYEEASDLVAVHRECHRRLEEANRRDACGCNAA